MNVVLSLLTYALGALAISLAALCYYLNSNFDYWKKRGVPYLQPEPFFGNVREITLLKKSMADVLTGLYRHFEGKRFAGIFMSRTPSMLLIDPELVKNVLVKDFGHFQFTTDVIGTCAFGLQLNSMSESESEFRKMGKKVFDPSVINDIRRFLGLLIPALAKRRCARMRFGLLQAKVGLAALVSRYQFHVCERTSIPLTIEPRTIVTSPKGGIWLRVSPRS
ncbi:Probable cytochrome P450 28a5 [Gryllus bimaculatus]|nr:Probable cytochrome P450 28a5 [Gryllus bimaculatus]